MTRPVFEDWKKNGIDLFSWHRCFNMRAVHILERALGEDENGAGMLGAAQISPTLGLFLLFLFRKTFFPTFCSSSVLAYGGLPTTTKDFLTIFLLQPSLVSSTVTTVFIGLWHSKGNGEKKRGTESCDMDSVLERIRFSSH